MYGDTDAIRGLARTMRAQGEALRAEGDVLLARAVTTPWEGVAAEAMRLRVHAQVDSLRRTAGLAEDAAVALDTHADQVDRLKALIAAVERRAIALIDAAKERIGGLIDAVLPDPLDELLVRFVPPPPGHLDWLHVELPGLR